MTKARKVSRSVKAILILMVSFFCLLGLARVFADANFTDAAKFGHIDQVRLAIALHVDVNTTDMGKTVLMYAAERGHADIVRTLIAAKADVNMRDSRGYTALMYATRYNYKEIVQLLLHSGAEKDTKATDGKSAYDIAVEQNERDIADTLNNAEK